MYPDPLPETRLAAPSSTAEVNARVAVLLAARRAAAAMANEAAVGAQGGVAVGEDAARLKEPALGLEPLPPPAPLPAAAADDAALERGPDDPRPGGSSTGACPSGQPGGRWWLVRNLVCLGTSFMVLYIAMKGAVNLQSSINAEVGLGNAGLASYYTGFLVSNFFLPTLTIRWLGCKMTVVVTILLYMPYIGAQLWPRFYTLVPGGLLAGLAAGPMWVAQGTYLSHLAEVHGARSGEQNDVLMVRLFGVFYMLYQMSQVWGNLVSSSVLSQGASGGTMLNNTRDICGAHFCPGPGGSDLLKHAKPASEHVAIISFSYIACIVVAAAIVVFGVDKVPRANSRSKRNTNTTSASTNTAPSAVTTVGTISETVQQHPQRHSSQTREDNALTYGGCGETERTPSTAVTAVTSVTSVSPVTTVTVDGGDRGNSDGESAMAVLCATLRLTGNLDLLLLVPITAFLGVEDSFLASEYTAAFVSCAWGIQYIGYVMICYGVFNSAAALLGGWVVKLTGRLPVVLGAAVLQTAVVAALRVWQPHPGDTTLFFAMAGMWGVTDGIWQAQINAMYGILFPGQEEAAYSSFRLWEGVGYIIAYSYSSLLCTDQKLYILLALMVVGVGGYITDEARQRKRAKRMPI